MKEREKNGETALWSQYGESCVVNLQIQILFQHCNFAHFLIIKVFCLPKDLCLHTPLRHQWLHYFGLQVYRQDVFSSILKKRFQTDLSECYSLENLNAEQEWAGLFGSEISWMCSCVGVLLNRLLLSWNYASDLDPLQCFESVLVTKGNLSISQVVWNVW